MAEERPHEIQVIVTDQAGTSTHHAEYTTGEPDRDKIAEQLGDILKSRLGKNWRPIDTEA